MICPKCNKQYADDEKFCSKCGSVLINENIYNVDVQPEQIVQPIESAEAVQAEEKENSQENAKKRWIIIGTVITIVLIVFLCWFFSPTESFKRCINADEYQEATAYHSVVHTDNKIDQAVVDKILENRAHEIFNNYNKGIIEYNEALESMTGLIRWYGNDTLNSIEKLFYELVESKEAFGDAQELEKSGDKLTALYRYIHVIPEDTNYEAVQARSEELRKEYKQEVLAQAEELKLKGPHFYQDALLLLEEAQPVMEGDADIDAAIEEYTELLEQAIAEEILVEAQEYINAGDYPSAISRLVNATVTTKDITKKLEEYQEAYSKVFLEEAELLYSEGNYEDAILCLNEGFLNCGEREEFTERREEYTAKYYEELLATAEEYAENGEYEQAVDHLQDAVIFWGSDSERETMIEEKIAEYEAKYPVRLCDVSATGSTHYTEDSYEDIYGNRFEQGLSIRTEGACEYVADSKYKTFKGTIMLEENTSGMEYYLKIYADDRLIYNSEKLTQKTRPIELNLDISGVTFVRFEVESEFTGGSYHPGRLLISDPVFIS